MSFLVGDSEIVFVVDDAGVFSLSLGIPVSSSGTTTTIGLSAGLVTDTDSILAPAVAAAAGAVTLSPALVTDPEVFYAPTMVAASAGALLPGTVADDDVIYAPNLRQDKLLLAVLVADTETIFAPNVGIELVSQTLLPSRIVDADVFYAATVGIGRFLQPARFIDPEAVYPAYGVDQPKPGHDVKLHWNFLSDPDVIFPARFPRTPLLWVDQDTIFAPWAFAGYLLQAPMVVDADSIPACNIGMSVPATLVPADDVIYRPGITLFLLPQRVAGDDTIPAADVGWQVIAQFTRIDDAYFAPYLQASNSILPGVWLDEEHLEGYPFRVQSIEGGIPVPQPPGVLTGSFSHPRRLSGTLGRKAHLTGSFANKTRRVLTGSLRHR